MSEKLSEREIRKKRGRIAWSSLAMLGLSQQEMAYGIHVDPGYFSRVINEEEDATLSEEKLRDLEEYVRVKTVAVVKQILGLGFAPVEVISTGYKPSEPFTSKEEKLIEEGAIDTIASLFAGRHELPSLPIGVRAATVHVDGDPHCIMYVITTKCVDGNGARQALIHEYEHLAALFKDKANELRGRGEQPKLPEKGF